MSFKLGELLGKKDKNIKKDNNFCFMCKTSFWSYNPTNLCRTCEEQLRQRVTK